MAQQDLHFLAWGAKLLAGCVVTRAWLVLPKEDAFAPYISGDSLPPDIHTVAINLNQMYMWHSAIRYQDKITAPQCVIRN